MFRIKARLQLGQPLERACLVGQIALLDHVGGPLFLPEADQGEQQRLLVISQPVASPWRRQMR